jgi:hypothetical protein
MNMVLLSLDSTDKGKQFYPETNNLPLDKEEGRRRDKTNLEKNNLPQVRQNCIWTSVLVQNQHQVMDT